MLQQLFVTHMKTMNISRDVVFSLPLDKQSSLEFFGSPWKDFLISRVFPRKYIIRQIYWQKTNFQCLIVLTIRRDFSDF